MCRGTLLARCSLLQSQDGQARRQGGHAGFSSGVSSHGVAQSYRSGQGGVDSLAPHPFWPHT